MKMKSVLSGILAFAISLAGVPSAIVSAHECTGFATGLATDAPVDYERSVEHSEPSRDYSNVTVLSQVDLSTDGYFPQIGNQGSYSSCVAWASTYYQFTHDAHKFNNITTTSANTYSPRWTYNFYNNGQNTVINYDQAYNCLRNQGAVTMSEYPYNVPTSTFYNWFTGQSAESSMINALSTRIEDAYTIILNTNNSNVKITSATDSDLIPIKQLLCAGKVLTVVSRSPSSSFSKKTTTAGEEAVYRVNCSGSGHALTIVGYDDSIQCDFNGDGIIQDTEKGAFKVANSAGTDYGNNGFTWIMYDALNKSSANTTNNWESSEPGIRRPVFEDMNRGDNEFTYIEIENPTVNIIGVVSFNASNCYGTSFTMKTTALPDNGISVFCQPPSTLSYSFNGSLVLDFGFLDDNIINYLSGYVWKVQFWNRSGNSITNVSYKIIDNKGNIINDEGVIYTSLPNNTQEDCDTTLNMQLGDVNYDGSVDGDDQIFVLKIITEIIDESNVSKMQLLLADYDQNGVINIIDVIAIGQASVRAGNGLSDSLDYNLIIELYRQYAAEHGLSQECDIYELFESKNAD